MSPPSPRLDIAARRLILADINPETRRHRADSRREQRAVMHSSTIPGMGRADHRRTTDRKRAFHTGRREPVPLCRRGKSAGRPSCRLQNGKTELLPSIYNPTETVQRQIASTGLPLPISRHNEMISSIRLLEVDRTRLLTGFDTTPI